jgi:hypothetical protein
MSEFYFYRGLYKVKVLTKSEGYWIVEAQEAFEDYLNDTRVEVKVGEQRIVPPNELHRRKVLAPPIPEHMYERKLEKKVKRLVEKYEQTNPA